MAVDQDLLDQIVGTVADLYREVEASLITVIADELKKGLDAPTAEVKLDAVTKLRAAAQAVYQRLQKTKSAAVREAIRAAYRDGHASALTGLPVSKAIKDDAKTALKQVPNAAIIENLAAALHRDLGRVEGNILRAPIDAYRAVQAGTAARIATGTATRRQASQAAWQRLMDRGIVGFTDRAGRQWRLSSYAEMIGRTNAQRAMVQGQTDRLASVGIDLVYISDNVQECKRCRPFESKVLRRNAGPIGKIRIEHGTRDGELVEVDVLMTLDQARAKGLFHPNCRHSASAYLPGVTKLKKNTEDPEGDIARQKQRALERRIRAEKEQALGALTPEAKKAANAGVRAAQAALRAHLAAHPKLKRLPYREQVGAGNIPGPGGPKGGPVGDMQPPAQPTLPDTPSRARSLDTAVPDRDPSMRRLITDTDGNDRSATVMRHTTEAIDRVHKMPPGMPSIPLNTEYGRNLGVYHRDPTGAPASISIDPAGRYPYLTSAHELGHFLDHAGFPPGLGFSVERQVKPGGLFHEWWKAVVDSDPIQVLLEIKDLRHDGEILVRRIRPDGSVNEVDVNHKHINYLTHPREAFGRSYAQWIATRSDDRRLLADLRLGQDWANGEQPVPGSGIYSGYPHYWDDQGFEPIAAALDEAFRRLGLLR